MRWYNLLAVAVLVLCFGAKAAGIDTMFEVIWDASSGRPEEATPKWRLYGTTGETDQAKGSDELVGGVFRFDTPRQETREGVYLPYRNYFIDSPSQWNPAKNPSLTMEFSARVVSVAPGADYGTAFGFSTGTASYGISLDEMGLTASDGQSVSLDTAQFHVYRIIWEENGGAKLYIDGATTPALTVEGKPSESRASIHFGASTNKTGGVAEWKYVAYTQHGAIAPE